ncbi:MAG: site-specific integrase [Bacteroidales bacterium]|jgi:integrase/recombinase XerD
MTSFEKYLEKKFFSKETKKAYRCITENFLLSNPKANAYNYQDILNYMAEISKHQISKATKQAKLTAIKKYYDYLVEEGIREDHPCRTLNIKGIRKKGIIFTDLFTMAELETLMEREERFIKMEETHKVIMSLLIYQALLPSEIIAIKTKHIDLEKGTIYAKGGRELIARHLELQPKQYRLLDEYIYKTRKKLLRKGKENDYLILNFRGKNYEGADGIGYLIETLKPCFPDRNLTTKSIRDSVISYWVNDRKIPLEQAQLLAGHRWISSTLRYRQTSIEEQREILKKFHPMG